MEQAHDTLYGACSCGRNRYTVTVPAAAAATSAHVLFDSSSATRLAHASPATTCLLIPLGWYASSTYAYYPDETHSSIRRVYHSSPSSVAAPISASQDAPEPQTPARQRHFCGFCGTHFSSWEEERQHQSQGDESREMSPNDGRISVAVETLLGDALDRLVKLGLWPESTASSDEDDQEEKEGIVPHQQSRSDPPQVILGERKRHLSRGAPWFEETMEDNKLGRVYRRRKAYKHGSTSVEWEIVELNSGDGVDELILGAEASGVKRKLEDVEGRESGAVRADVDMR